MLEIVAGEHGEALGHPALDQMFIAVAAAVIVAAAVERRTAAKYGGRGGRYVAFEARCTPENLLLKAVALGLGAVVVGAFDDGRVGRILHLGPRRATHRAHSRRRSAPYQPDVSDALRNIGRLEIERGVCDHSPECDRVMSSGGFDYGIPWAIAGLLGLVWITAAALGATLEQLERIFAILLAIATITGITVGGVWTYHRFVKERTDVSNLVLDYNVETVRLPDYRWLLKVAVKITNVGRTLVALRLWQLRAEQILPCTPETLEFLQNHTAFTEWQSVWPTVAGDPREYLDSPDFRGIDVEPGETDYAMGNLVIPADCEVIQVYSELKESARDRLSWVRQCVVRMGSEVSEHGQKA